MRIIKDHKVKTLTISGKNMYKKGVNRQKANFLVIKLVDLVEVKDLKINFANKEVYQLINDTNKAKYYYD